LLQDNQGVKTNFMGLEFRRQLRMLFQPGLNAKKWSFGHWWWLKVQIPPILPSL